MNSMLSMYSRPTVVFDVTNKQHRQWAHRFMTARSWSGCPVQFALPHSEDNVYTMLMRQLTRHYIQKEFGALPQDEHEDHIARIVAESPQLILKERNR
jgi:hypothetical protein